ncbi:MAG: terminase gpA endonuclease subunit [Planctomycetota bacterium]
MSKGDRQLDPRRLRPVDAVRLLNSTPAGDTLTAGKLRRHREAAGYRLGKDRVDLVAYCGWLLERRHKPEPKVRGYDERKEAERNRQAQLSKSGRDIGPIPDIVNPERREACRLDLRLFLETYQSSVFRWPWSEHHLIVIERLQTAVLAGARSAIAMPRGGGKSSLCRGALTWAVAYAHRRYPYLIGATGGKAEEGLEAIKTFIRFSDLFAEDWPEIALPIRLLGGINNRAAGQLCGGEPTLIEWSRDRVVLPTVPPPVNLECSGELAPTSGIVIGASGLTGEGIRGSSHTLRTGEVLRPDLVLSDDPSSDESAMSPSQNNKRERLMNGAVLGMAGPGQSISCVMPCTVVYEDDLADRTLDRKRNPLWRGERFALLASMPKNMAAWERYGEVYQRCMSADEPDVTPANDHYLENRAALDLGAAATWEHRKLEEEVSSVQHAMNIYFAVGPEAFYAEYQNDPALARPAGTTQTTAESIVDRVNRLPRGVVPNEADFLTAFVDVHDNVLYFAVVAWRADFTGSVIDYSTYPEQDRAHFRLADARITLASVDQTDEDEAPGVEGQVMRGLQKLTDDLCGREWPREDGTPVTIRRCLVDAGYLPGVVHQVCRRSPHRAVLQPAKGRAIGAKQTQFSEYKDKPGEQLGENWRVVSNQRHSTRLVLQDPNFWKSHLHQRLRIKVGDAGALTFFGEKPERHRLIADHLTAERGTLVNANGNSVTEWSVVGSRDNHYLDCLVGAAVGASMEGTKVPAGPSSKNSKT